MKNFSFWLGSHSQRCLHARNYWLEKSETQKWRKCYWTALQVYIKLSVIVYPKYSLNNNLLSNIRWTKQMSINIVMRDYLACIAWNKIRIELRNINQMICEIRKSTRSFTGNFVQTKRGWPIRTLITYNFLIHVSLKYIDICLKQKLQLLYHYFLHKKESSDWRKWRFFSYFHVSFSPISSSCGALI